MVTDTLGVFTRNSRNEIEKLLENDYSYEPGRILSSMCTDPHPIALGSFLKYHQKNLGDPALFPGAQELERRAVAIISDLLHGDSNEVAGSFVSGGSEANITSLWAAKKLAYRENSPTKSIILALQQFILQLLKQRIYYP